MEQNGSETIPDNQESNETVENNNSGGEKHKYHRSGGRGRYGGRGPAPYDRYGFGSRGSAPYDRYGFNGRPGKTCSNCDSPRHLRANCPEPPQCHACGSYEHEKKDCPHTNKTCDICHKVGHLRAKCLQRFNIPAPQPYYDNDRYNSYEGYGAHGGNRYEDRYGRYDDKRGYDNGYGNRGFSNHSFADRTFDRRPRARYRPNEHNDGEDGDSNPLAKKRCDNCGKMGHIRAMCKTPPECHACGSFNHLKMDCTHLDKTCNLCKKVGHLKSKCQLLNS